MKVTGITGESTDSNHRGWIDVVSYNWTVQDLSSGHVTPGAFQVVAEFGVASPQLFQDAADGNNLPQVTIQVQSTNSNGQSVQVCTWTLSNVIVVSYSTCSGVNGDTRILDQYNFLPEKVQVQYVPTNGNGQPGSPVTTSFDFSQSNAS